MPDQVVYENPFRGNKMIAEIINSGLHTAAVTGASSGIGRAYAHHLAHQGFNLIIMARRKKELEGLKHELEKTYGVQVTVAAMDLSNSRDLDRAATLLGKEPVGILVHAAGFGTRGFIADTEPSKLHAMIHLHNMAAVMLSRAVLPGMMSKQAGIVVMVSSLAAFFTTAEYTLYSATKSFLNTFVTGLRDEVAHAGIKVQAVCPGLTRTGFMYTEEYRDFDYSAVPDGAWQTPEQVVEESWKALDKNQPVIVTGGGNRFFVALMSMPVLGSGLRALFSSMSRKRIREGKQALF